MKRAALVMLLLGCTAGVNDYPSRPGGGTVIIGGGSGGTGGDAGVSDGGDAGVVRTGRLCIVSDLRAPTRCDTTKDASVLAVSLGAQRPDVPPAKTGEFTIHVQSSTELFWQVTGTNFITTVMRFGSDNTIPVVPDTLYRDLTLQNSVIINAQGQGSVVVRALSGGVPAPGVVGSTTLISGNVIPRYDENSSAVDWNQIGPTQSAGILWFPGVQVTTAGRITLRPAVGSTVDLNDIKVVDQAITFVAVDFQ
ncbi:MAG: hypothetical protein E6J90_33550 [Deltaproteobacteria bacterium]|nr:MAG: hypothetical protein E6J90_33550 [Deltaproteobacteria bacterium]